MFMHFDDVENWIGGIGTLEAIDTVYVRWLSGLVQLFENLPINKTVELVEGQPGWLDVYERANAAKYATALHQ